MNLEELPISEASRALVRTSMSNYQRYARVWLRVDSLVNGLTGAFAFCTVAQEEAGDLRALSAAELLERAEEALAPLAAEGIRPLVTVKPMNEAVKKHRSLPTSGDGQLVLRMVKPRALVALQAGNDRVVVMEEAGEKEGTVLTKARAWADRARYRDHGTRD